MYCLANLFAEQDRRQEMVEEIIREQTIRDLLADKRPFNPLLYTLGKQLSNAGRTPSGSLRAGGCPHEAAPDRCFLSLQLKRITGLARNSFGSPSHHHNCYYC